MNWSTLIDSKSYVNGLLQVGVVYTNGTTKFSESYTLNTAAQLDVLIKNRLAQLVSLDTLNSTLTVGPYVPAPDVTPITIPDPFKDSLSHLQLLNTYVQLGIITSSDPSYISALSTAQANLPKNP